MGFGLVLVIRGGWDGVGCVGGGLGSNLLRCVGEEGGVPCGVRKGDWEELLAVMIYRLCDVKQEVMTMKKVKIVTNISSEYLFH